MTNVLIACSLAPRAKATITASIRIADGWKAKKSFCHIGDDTPDTRSRLQLLLADCGIYQPTLVIRPGIPEKVINQIALDLKVDLIIAGALSHEPSLIGIWGSVSRRLVRQAACSVLLLTDIKNDFQAFQHIVLRLNCYKEAKAIAVESIELAVLMGATLHLVHEVDYALRLLSCEETTDSHRRHAYEKECLLLEQEKLRDFIEGLDLKGLKPAYICLAAKDQFELKTYITRKSIDLIITPSPKQWQFWERFFNMTVESVLQDMPCSILFYRDSACR